MRKALAVLAALAFLTFGTNASTQAGLSEQPSTTTSLQSNTSHRTNHGAKKIETLDPSTLPVEFRGGRKVRGRFV